jgi:hypothetical protein
MAVVCFHNNEDNKSSHSFMAGFASAYSEPSDFETFVNHIRSFEIQMREQGFPIEETVNMSALYDSYLAGVDERRGESGISAWQAKRFDAIVDKHDDGWSGAVYGLICRVVQRDLRAKYQGNN